MTLIKLENGVAIGSMEQDISTGLKDLKKQQEDLNIEYSTLEYYRKYFLRYQDSSRLLYGIIDQQHTSLSANILALDQMQSQLRDQLLKLTPSNPQIINLQNQV